MKNPNTPAVKGEADEAWGKSGGDEASGKNGIMIYGPKSDGTYVVEFKTAAGRGAGDLNPRKRGG